MTAGAEPYGNLARFTNHNYLNLITFRKNGQEVSTPVWFVEDQGRLYVRTGASSGKVKRIRRNTGVRLVPSDARGNPKGEWLDGTAHLVDDATAEKVNGLLKKKYGLMKSFFDLLGKFSRAESATLVIQLR